MSGAPTAPHFCAGRRKPACSHCFVFWLLSLSISYRVTLFWDQSWAFFVAADVLVKARFLPSYDVRLRNSCCVCTVVWGNLGRRFRYFDISTCGKRASSWRSDSVIVEARMRRLFVVLLFAGTFASIGSARAADGCGFGCHATSNGACVVDGWAAGIPVRNECPAGARPRPPCGEGYVWRKQFRACALK